MIGVDTVTLTFPQSEFGILKPGDFTPNANKVTQVEPKDMGKGKYMQATRNPTKQEAAIYGYLPYITLYRAIRAGGYTTGLRVQFSLPKVVNSNNFDELNDDDFEIACERIYEALKIYGIRFFKGKSAIQNAQVAVIHYAKNFPLSNFMSAHQAINDIQKCDVTSWRDVAENGYINGCGYKTHSKYYELAFYDKIAEYNKGKRGQPTFDKDLQLEFDLFGNKKIACDVVRMEARLGNTRTIKNVLAKAGLAETKLTFTELCTEQISRAVLLQQLDEMYSRYPKITNARADTGHDLLSELLVSNPDRNIGTLLSAIGLWTLNQHNGTRQLKDIVGTRGSPALLRLTKRLNDELNYRSEKPEIFQLMKGQLNSFEPVHVADFLK
jgi:hypothetical protein